jgi:hypothetical protein
MLAEGYELMTWAHRKRGLKGPKVFGATDIGIIIRILDAVRK